MLYCCAASCCAVARFDMPEFKSQHTCFVCSLGRAEAGLARRLGTGAGSWRAVLAGVQCCAAARQAAVQWPCSLSAHAATARYSIVPLACLSETPVVFGHTLGCVLM